jgi:hypothetical protein
MGAIRSARWLRAVRRICSYSFALLLIVGILLIGNSARLCLYGESAVGVVTGLKQEKGADGNWVYRPEFSFSANGQQVRGQADVSSNPPSYRPGECNTADLRQRSAGEGNGGFLRFVVAIRDDLFGDRGGRRGVCLLLFPGEITDAFADGFVNAWGGGTHSV